MASPTSLGLVATGDLYLPGGASSIVSPLVLTTLVDVPRSKAPHFTALMILIRTAPISRAGFPDAGAILGTITDDAPDPADGLPVNVYQANGFDGDGAFAYDFGRPTASCPPGFDIQVSGADHIGGSAAGALYCFPTRPLPAGTQITIPFTTNSPFSFETTYLGATVLAFTDGGNPDVFLAARTINPADTSDGNSANVPLGDHTFDEILGSAGVGFEQAIAHVWADDAHSTPSAGDYPPDAPAIDGTQTIDDTSGRWTKIDSGGRDSTSAYGGLVYSVFTCDTSLTDLSQPMVTFEISDGIGVDDPAGPFAGVAMYRTQFQRPTGNPAFNRVIPV